MNVLGLLDPKVGGTVLLWNICGCLPVSMASDLEYTTQVSISVSSNFTST